MMLLSDLPAGWMVLVGKSMWIMTVGMCAVTYALLDKPWVDPRATNRVQSVALVSDRCCLFYRPLYGGIL